MISKTQSLQNSLERCLVNLGEANIDCKVSKNAEGNLETIILNDLVRLDSTLKRSDKLSITYNLLYNRTLIELKELDTKILEGLITCLNQYSLTKEDSILNDALNGTCSLLTSVEMYLRGTLVNAPIIHNPPEEDLAYIKMLCERYVNFNNLSNERIKVIELSLV